MKKGEGEVIKEGVTLHDAASTCTLAGQHAYVVLWPCAPVPAARRGRKRNEGENVRKEKRAPRSGSTKPQGRCCCDHCCDPLPAARARKLLPSLAGPVATSGRTALAAREGGSQEEEKECRGLPLLRSSPTCSCCCSNRTPPKPHFPNPQHPPPAVPPSVTPPSRQEREGIEEEERLPAAASARCPRSKEGRGRRPGGFHSRRRWEEG